MNEKKLLFPNIETERLFLRELRDEDIDFIFKHFSDENVCMYLYDAEPLKEVNEAREIVEWYKNSERKNHSRWGIEHKENKKIIGTCGYHCWDRINNIAEIGYDLGKEFWGQGYMTEALTSIIQNGFNNMALNRIQAFVYTDNKRSNMLLEKLGFVNEGVIREKHLFRGKYYDHYCYSLLKNDWLTK